MNLIHLIHLASLELAQSDPIAQAGRRSRGLFTSPSDSLTVKYCNQDRDSVATTAPAIQLVGVSRHCEVKQTLLYQKSGFGVSYRNQNKHFHQNAIQQFMAVTCTETEACPIWPLKEDISKPVADIATEPVYC